jgi:hypothetical protein
MLVDKETDESEDEEYESEDEEDEDSVDIMSAEEEASPAEKMEAPPAEKMEAPPARNREALSAEKMVVLAAEERTRFVNVRTGTTLLIRMRPEYGDVLTIVSAEGLLVLHCDRTDTVRLYNPLTTYGNNPPSRLDGRAHAGKHYGVLRGQRRLRRRFPGPSHRRARGEWGTQCSYDPRQARRRPLGHCRHGRPRERRRSAAAFPCTGGSSSQQGGEKCSRSSSRRTRAWR